VNDIAESYESGDKYRLTIPGLSYGVDLPYVILDGTDPAIRIASLNLVGQIRLNQDFGALLAQKIKSAIGTPEGVIILTAVEKALQLTQVVAHLLGLDAVAVAYNRIKPHMEAARRQVIRVQMDSITSGDKCLVLYERDINLILNARRGIILIDDVVSTGGTVYGLTRLIRETLKSHPDRTPPELLGIFCVAQEGGALPDLPAPVISLATLPEPQQLQGAADTNG